MKKIIYNKYLLYACVKKRIRYILFEYSTENSMNRHISQATTVLEYIYITDT